MNPSERKIEVFVNGIKEYDKQGREIKTGIVAGSASKDGEIKIFDSGKRVGSVSVIAYHRQDGTAVFLTVKAWGDSASIIGRLEKGDRFLAAGRIETREYNGKTYTDLIADLFLTEKKAAPLIQAGAPAKVSADGFEEISDDPAKLPF